MQLIVLLWIPGSIIIMAYLIGREIMLKWAFIFSSWTTIFIHAQKDGSLLKTLSEGRLFHPKNRGPFPKEFWGEAVFVHRAFSTQIAFPNTSTLHHHYVTPPICFISLNSPSASGTYDAARYWSPSRSGALHWAQPFGNRLVHAQIDTMTASGGLQSAGPAAELILTSWHFQMFLMMTAGEKHVRCWTSSRWTICSPRVDSGACCASSTMPLARRWTSALRGDRVPIWATSVSLGNLSPPTWQRAEGRADALRTLWRVLRCRWRLQKRRDRTRSAFQVRSCAQGGARQQPWSSPRRAWQSLSLGSVPTASASEEVPLQERYVSPTSITPLYGLTERIHPITSPVRPLAFCCPGKDLSQATFRIVLETFGVDLPRRYGSPPNQIIALSKSWPGRGCMYWCTKKPPVLRLPDLYSIL